MEEGSPSPRALQILPAKPTVIPVLSVFFLSVCLSLSFVLLLVSLSPWELGGGVRGVKRGNFFTVWKIK